MALTDNIVAYYKLDESSGNAADAVGSNTLVNTATTYTAAKINNGASFNGSTSKLLGGAFTGGSVFSISAWINPTNLTSVHTILGEDGVSGGGVQFRTEPTTGYLGLISTGVVAIGYSTTGVSSGVLSHVVVTYDASGNYVFYINGTSVGSGTNLKTLTAHNLQLGASQTTITEQFIGVIDEVGVWARVLSGTEVSQLYNSGNGLQYPFGTAYTLVAAVGSFTLTGIATTLLKALHLTASAGSFVLTGIDIVFRLGKGIVAETGNFILTGQSATITSARTIIASAGSFTLTGISSTLTFGRRLVASTGSFVLTGINAILRPSNIWTAQSKNSATWTSENKSSAPTWTAESKNS